jgi:tripartite-type tricarboxylate transporter receptor subunit TctC
MRTVLIVVLMLCGISSCFGSDPYPMKPVRIILPYAGGSLDAVTRAIAARLTEQLGKPVIVETRPGAGGLIAAEYVARSQPDGYTILPIDLTVLLSASTRKSSPIAIAKDFTPISQLSSNPLVLVVPASLSAHTLGEFIALAKANPGTLNYATAGPDSLNQVSASLFLKAAGIEAVAVPYKGGGEISNALITGQVQMSIVSVGVAVAFVNSGNIRPLAVTTPSGKRSVVMPDVPSMSEAGIPSIVLGQWFGIVGPAGLPTDVVNKLNAELIKAIAAPSVKDVFATLGIDAVGSSSEDFSRHLQAELQSWGDVIKSSGIPLE